MSRHPGLDRDPAQVDLAQVDRAEPADRTDRAGPAEPHLVDRRPADPVGARRVVQAELTRPADQAHPRLADPHLPDPVDRAGQGPVDLVAMDLAAQVGPHPANLVVRAGLDPADMVRVDPVGRVGRVGLAVPADTDRAVRADPVSLDLAARVDQVNRVGPVGLVDQADLMGLAALVVHPRLPMCSAVSTIGVARNSAVPETRRTGSAHPTTVRRRRPRSAGSVGTTGLLRGILRRTGTDRPLRAVGTVRRLPGVGTRRGTALAAI